MYKYLLIYVVCTMYSINSLTINENEEGDRNAKYKFSYKISDLKTGNYHSREEERLGDIVRGQYILQEPDGFRRMVKYKVDGQSGFVATVHRDSDCVHCPGGGTPFAVAYRMNHRTSNGFVNSYFYMGSGLPPS